MNKLIKCAFLLAPLLLSGCSTSPNEDSNPNSANPPSSVEPPATQSNVLHGHGAPTQDIGEANSLYVDEDTNLIYEKGVKVTASTSSAKRAVTTSEAKWISTNCTAGENFDGGSAIGNAVRSSLFATNVTLKLTMDIEATDQEDQHVISYLAYNCGNVIMKNVIDTTDDSFDNAMTIGYSTYDNDNSTYSSFFLYVPMQGLVDKSDIINSNSPETYTFIRRCLGDYFNSFISPKIVDTFVQDVGNFTVNEGVYSLNKNIDTTSPLTSQLGSEDTFVKLSDFSFKLNSNGDALEYFQFGIRFGLNDQSRVFNEVIKAEVKNLRTTAF